MSSENSATASSDENDDTIESFEQFWDFYVGEHKEKANRILHFIGTTTAMGCIAGGLLTRRRWLLLVAPLAGYGCAWVGHFFIEKNKPASFKYPLWSLRADFKMWWKMATFSMQDEVDRVVREQATREEEKRDRENASSETNETNPQESTSAGGDERASVQSEAVN